MLVQLFATVVFWTCINVVVRLLPATPSLRRANSASFLPVRSIVSVTAITFKLTTIAWNNYFRLNHNYARLARVFYTLGPPAALFIMGVTATNLIISTSVNLWSSASQLITATTPATTEDTNNHVFETDVDAWRRMHTFCFSASDHRDGSWSLPVPGVNIPWSHALPYLLALVISTIVHELGHALAAGSEHVRVQSIGVFIYGIIPGAYVNLRESDLADLNVLPLLRIYTAGIWHNILLSYAAFFCLITHVLWKWGYTAHNTHGSGLMVIEVLPQSDLANVLQPYVTLITHINRIPVNEPYHFYHILHQARLQPPKRMCFPNIDFVDVSGMTIVEAPIWTAQRPTCCAMNSSNTIGESGLLCFTNEQVTNHVHLFNRIEVNNYNKCDLSATPVYACVNYPDLLYLGKRHPIVYSPCTEDSDCQRLLGDAQAAAAVDRSHIRGGHHQLIQGLLSIHQASLYAPKCLQLVLPHPDMTVLELEITESFNMEELKPTSYYNNEQMDETNETRRSIIWLGALQQLARDGNVFPHYRGLPTLLPYFLDRLCLYIMQISLAIGSINALPLPYLDGAYVLQTLQLPSFVKKSITIGVAGMFILNLALQASTYLRNIG